MAVNSFLDTLIISIPEGCFDHYLLLLVALLMRYLTIMQCFYIFYENISKHIRASIHVIDSIQHEKRTVLSKSWYTTNIELPEQLNFSD
ncbi:Exportin-T [Dirofilaria immitis]